MKNSIKRIIEDLEEWPYPVITQHDLQLKIFDSFSQDGDLGETADLSFCQIKREWINGAITTLEESRILIREKSNSRIWRLFGKKKTTAEQWICGVDPFAVIGFLSAMAYHGLTDKFANTVYYLSVNRNAWSR